MILEDEVNFPVSISHPLPSPGMDEVLFCMTSAAVQQGCCAGWGHLHCWPATGCPVPRPPLLGLLPSSSCSCHRSTGRACPVLGQCLPSPSTPGSFPASAPTSPSKGIHGTQRGRCNPSLQQGYSSSKRRVIYPLDITYTGVCFAIYIFGCFTAVMAAQYWLDLLLNDDNTMLLICHSM